jgi:hypothetical protein
MESLSVNTVASFWDELGQIEKVAYAYNDDEEDDRRVAKSRREAGAIVGAVGLAGAGAGGYAYNKHQKALAREAAEELAARSVKGRAGAAAAGLGALAMGAFGKGLADAAGGSVERMGRNTWAAPGKAVGRRRASILGAAREAGRKKAKIRKAQISNAHVKARLKWWKAEQGAHSASRKKDQVTRLLASKRGRDARAAGRARHRRSRLEAQAAQIRARRNNPPAGHTPRWKAPKRGK